MKHKLIRVAAAAVMSGVVALIVIATGLDRGLAIDSYRDLKRQLADYRLARTLSPVPCPQKAFVVVAIGQSNAANHVEGLTPIDDDAKAYSFFWGRCFLIKDPLPGATGRMGSLWSLFAQRLSKRMKRPVVVIAGGAAGSSITNWHKDTAGMFSRLARRIRAASRQGLEPDLVLWHQGEADSAQKLPGERYQVFLERLIGKFDILSSVDVQRKGQGKLPRWLVFLVSRCWNKASINEQIRAAQRAVAAKNERVSLGPDTDLLGDEFRYDRCHFNAVGREHIVSDLLDRLKTFKDWQRILEPAMWEDKP